MEFFKIIGIGLSEGCRYMYRGSFDTYSFWQRCMRVNVIYAKFFQAIAVHYDFSEDIHSIPYTDNELLYPKDIPVTGIIGTGLISIVFEGEIDGVPIVVKTKRRDIERRVCSTLAALEKWIRRLNCCFRCPLLLKAYTDISENFKTQLDFKSEFNNHVLFLELYKELPYLRVPRLYPELCNEDQIVMTKLSGIPINTLTEDEKIQTTKWLAQIIVHGTMKHGFTHSDLHVGNLIFNKDSIGIIDFGFVLKFNELDKNIFYNLLKEFAMDNLEEAAYYTMLLTEPEEARDNLSVEDIKDITNFIIHTYKKATTVDMFFSIYDILQINKKLNTYNLGISPTFYKGVVGLNSIEGVLSHLSSTTSDFVICAITDFVDT